MAATTQAFTPMDAMRMRQYDLMASPLVYPGQRLQARLSSGKRNAGPVKVALRARYYGGDERLVDIDSTPADIAPNSEATVSFVLPDHDSQPIAEIGIVLLEANTPGSVELDYLKWERTPALTLRRPDVETDYWHQAWVNGAHIFAKTLAQGFHVSQDYGDGLIIYGTRDWTDYEVELQLTLHLGPYCGVTVRTQGLRRYYAVRLLFSQRIQIVRVRDDDCAILAEADMKVALEEPVAVSVRAVGNRISVQCEGIELAVEDSGDEAIASGGIGILAREGATSTSEIRVGPPTE
jgi:hypothetical protein